MAKRRSARSLRWRSGISWSSMRRQNEAPYLRRVGRREPRARRASRAQRRYRRRLPLDEQQLCRHAAVHRRGAQGAQPAIVPRRLVVLAERHAVPDRVAAGCGCEYPQRTAVPDERGAAIMAVMMGRLYAALREANVPEDKATAAAEEIAAYDNRLAAIESRLAVLTWMVGSTIALVAAVGMPALWLLLRVASKVGAL